MAIGRNEGERLRACLVSALSQATKVVYVDSNSTDRSVSMARDMGAIVVELDMSVPFTAARARNEGFAKLDDVEFVQFVDGDCEIVAGWVHRAVEEMNAKPQAAVVCGRRREKFPEASIYNALCDMEWDTPLGEVRACGGDALIRAEAFREVGGYDASVIAGEEPEMCVRLREKGWKIMRIDAEMTRHDAAMKYFGQWWKRSVRAGHAFAEGYAMHGKSAEHHKAREIRSIIVYALLLPIFMLVTGVGLLAGPALGLLIYIALLIRIALRKRRAGVSRRNAWAYAASVVIGKFPQLTGILKYHIARIRGRRSAIIEYKGPALA